MFTSPNINYLSPLLSSGRGGYGNDEERTYYNGGDASLLYRTYQIRDEDVKTLPFQSPERKIEEGKTNFWEMIKNLL